MTKKPLILLVFLFTMNSGYLLAQTWTDTLDLYARTQFMPPSKFQWKWQKAALLSTMVKQYDKAEEKKKEIYLKYIQKCMQKTMQQANGKTPNAVASGLGMAFLYRVTREGKYKEVCDKIYKDYLLIKRSKDGGVSHLVKNIELWDDTIFMIGEFLIEMYRATGDTNYIDELVKQVSIHRNKLQDPEWGLWVHGWDNDNKSHCTFCGQMYWPDKSTRKSSEIWGRGNGWIVVTLSDAIECLPQENKQRSILTGYLKEMLYRLPELQDKNTGHWYQLPVKNNHPKNYIESSCTAMFAYGISRGLQMGIIQDSSYNKSVELAYIGLRNFSVQKINNDYITTKNVCKGTCIGDETYYLNRKVCHGKPFGIGMFIAFGRAYERIAKP